MAGKGTGKYYAPVYRAKKSPAKLRQMRLFKRCAIISAAVVIAAVSIAAFQINKDDSESFVKVAASKQSFAEVSCYPRVVNSDSPLTEEFVPENLMSLGTLPGGDNILLRADAAEAFTEMCTAMSQDGLGIVPVKGYISYDEQRNELTDAADRLVAEGASDKEAKKQAAAEVSAPGENEAQLGTTVEISTDANTVDGFALTEQYQWICRNAHKYGFIIRYTANKKKVTGISAQPWRLRFVGHHAAEIMVSSNMCLEEYVRAVKAANPKAAPEI